MSTARSHWSTRFAFILAAVGSAVGLGNLWKFPYMAGANGGGAFVLIYLLCIAAVGVPIFIAELYIGQKGQKNAVASFEATHEKNTPWRCIGFMGLASAFIILSFYSVVGGWILDFSFKSIFNQFAGKSDEEVKGFLGALFESPWTQVGWHFVFMTGTVGIVLGGVRNGIEKWNKILMPTLFALLGVLFIYSFTLSGFSQSISFLFSPDTSKLTAAGVLEAVGHSFFTLSLGMGAIITYGSYLKKKEGLAKIAITVAFLDTLVALIAGVVIFSVVFTHGMEPGGGPTLLFQTLPVLFSKMTGGYILAVAFFLLVAFAAFSSSVSLLEVAVAYWVETKKKDRVRTTLLIGIVIFGIGVLSALSTNVLSDVKIFKFTFFDLFDKLTSSIFLPLGGVLISLFYGWVLGPKAIEESLSLGKKPSLMKIGLLWTTRVLAPVAVMIVLVKGVMDF